jgi:site-specific DNA-methyltransferase (adenine-specific)
MTFLYTAKARIINSILRGLKLPCDVMDDLGNFSTVSKERIKLKDGKCFKWQKPQKLFNRIVLPFTDTGDLVIDPFMGVGSLGIWCKRNNRDYIGMETDKELYEISRQNLGL